MWRLRPRTSPAARPRAVRRRTSFQRCRKVAAAEPWKRAGIGCTNVHFVIELCY